MGAVMGTVSVEMPEHNVVHKASNYEVWRYPSSVAATVYAKDVVDPKTNQIPTQQRFTGIAFQTLARYIGVFNKPENTSSTNSSTEEKVAMTAPVVVEPPAEKIAMTAPVLVQPPSEQVAMTAPVVVQPPSENIDTTQPAVKDEKDSADGASMKFLLPSKYKTIEDAPKPTNPAVVLEMVPGGRCEAVFTYNGNFDMNRATEKAKELLEALQADNVKVVGDWTVQGYNPPFTLPMLKRNEIHVPVDATMYPEEDPESNNPSN